MDQIYNKVFQYVQGDKCRYYYDNGDGIVNPRNGRHCKIWKFAIGHNEKGDEFICN